MTEVSTIYYPKDTAAQKNWTRFTLLIPSVSVGNVGQLAMDLIIYSLQYTKVGTILDDSITPVIGNDPYTDSNKDCDLMTACEVFENTDNHTVAIQIRSPLIRGKRQQFIDKLLLWINEMKFSRILVLGSTQAYHRTDAQLCGSQLRYVGTKTGLESSGEVLDKYKIFEKEADGSLYMPGGGIIRPLLETCERSGLNMVSLMKFCMEGDNCDDALQLADFMSDWLKWKKVQWKMPPSWKHQFGNNVDKTIF